MSRLTKWFADSDEYGHNSCFGGCESCNGVLCGNALEMIKKLAHYEDLEDQLEELYGGRLSLDNVVDNLNRIVQNGEEKLDFARILTNDEAEKWDHWKALEEQGRLIELPCKVGDTVWFIAYNGMHFWDGKPLHEVETTKFYLSLLEQIGTTVFLTKEEAEEKLAELKGAEE